MPLGGGTLTAGTQDSYTRTSLDYRMLSQSAEQYIPSSYTVTRQTSLAAFASWKRNFGPLGLRAGVRYEYTDFRLDTDGVRDDDVSRRDHLVTPDLSVSWQPEKGPSLSLSYRMATVRPPYSQLTGSLSYVGRHEIEGAIPPCATSGCITCSSRARGATSCSSPTSPAASTPMPLSSGSIPPPPCSC